MTPVVRHHAVAPDSRATIDVNEDAAGLAYRDVGSAPLGRGHEQRRRAGAVAQMVFAEGLTNPVFDTYLLLLNPGTTAAQVDIDVLRMDGPPIKLTCRISPRSRVSVHVNTAHLVESVGDARSVSHALRG